MGIFTFILLFYSVEREGREMSEGGGGEGGSKEE